MRVAPLLLVLCAGCPTATRSAPTHPTPPPADPPPEAPALLPITKGTRWTYTGTLRWFDKKARKDRELAVEWLVECTDVVRSGDATGYVLRGWPEDLVWSEGEAQRGDWLLVHRGKQWFVDRASAADVEQFRRDPASRTGEDDLLLEEPLSDGKRMCKDDSTYCWEVTADGQAFDLTYRTNPDTTTIEITPGVGLTAYDYVHHGTIAEVHVRLAR